MSHEIAHLRTKVDRCEDSLMRLVSMSKYHAPIEVRDALIKEVENYYDWCMRNKA